MVEVVPTIIPESFEDIRLHAGQVKGLVQRVQIDIANGTYAPSRTWPYNGGPEATGQFARIVREEEGLPYWKEIDYELDMLIAEPEKELEKWVSAGISAAVIHIETTKNYSNVLQNYRIEKGVEIGWGIKPRTPNETLFEVIEAAGMPDFVQVMGNDKIGYHGVELDERVYDKIHDIRKRYPELSIAVDIGVNRDTAPKLVEAGATKLAAGSAIFASEDIAESIRFFEQLL